MLRPAPALPEVVLVCSLEASLPRHASPLVLIIVASSPPLVLLLAVTPSLAILVSAAPTLVILVARSGSMLTPWPSVGVECVMLVSVISHGVFREADTPASLSLLFGVLRRFGV